MKPRMTKQRKAILEKVEQTKLMFGYTDHGCREFWFEDCSNANQEIINSMIDVGLLKISEDGPFGIGQTLPGHKRD